MRSTVVAIAIAVAVQAVVATVTLKDLARRPAAGLRGPKLLWQIAGTVNTVGSIAYWAGGRKRL